MSFLGGSSSPAVPPPADQAAKKQMVMDQLTSQLQLANAQELIKTMNDKCFQKCITKPSTEISSWETGCLNNCMDRYMQAFDIVSRTYVKRITQEASQASSSFL